LERKALQDNTSGDSGRSLVPPLVPDPDLARVVAAWPRLPEHIRKTILSLLQAVEAAESQPAPGSKSADGI
jgi:hypothetical protein